MAESPAATLPTRRSLAVIDDDDDVRRALTRLLTACRHDVKPFPSAEAFLRDPVVVECAIVDVQLSGMSGIDLEQQLRASGRRIPVIFISAIEDTSARDAMRRRGHAWLQKPFDETELFDAISRATDTAG